MEYGRNLIEVGDRYVENTKSGIRPKTEVHTYRKTQEGIRPICEVEKGRKNLERIGPTGEVGT